MLVAGSPVLRWFSMPRPINACLPCLKAAQDFYISCGLTSDYPRDPYGCWVAAGKLLFERQAREWWQPGKRICLPLFLFPLSLSAVVPVFLRRFDRLKSTTRRMAQADSWPESALPRRLVTLQKHPKIRSQFTAKRRPLPMDRVAEGEGQVSVSNM
jgi:hypothetical protein